MLSLKTIGTRENTATVTLRGNAVEVRGLTVAERDRLRALFLRPAPPVGKNPEKGDLAPPEPLHNDPQHRAKVEQWKSLTLAIEAAIALDWCTTDNETWVVGNDDERCRAWGRKAAKEIAEAGFSDAEIDTVFRAVAQIERGGDPRGN